MRVALLVGVLACTSAVSVFLWSAQADAQNGPDMSVKVPVQGCTALAKCSFTQGTKFIVQINAVAVPDPNGTSSPPPGFSGYQIILDYTGAINVQNGSASAGPGKFCPHNLFQAKGPDEQTGAHQYVVQCKASSSTTFTNYTGPLVNIGFVCKKGSGSITLVGGAGAKVSFYDRPSTIVTNRYFLKSSHTLTINCINPTPTSTPSATPSRTASATPTNTASATPTNTASATPTNTASATPTNTASATPTDTASATPTNTASATPTNTASATPTNTASATPTTRASVTPTKTASSTATRTVTPLSATVTPEAKKTPDPRGPHMALRVFSDVGKTKLICTKGIIGRVCPVVPHAVFSVDVKDIPPPAGFIGYQIVLQYSSNLNLVPQDGLLENRWPDCPNHGYESNTPPSGATPGKYILGCKAGQPPRHFKGTLANIHFSCKQGTGQIDIIGGAGPEVSFFDLPSINGNRTFLASTGKGSKQVGDAVTINCSGLVGQGSVGGDTDADGCSDEREQGPSEMLGGRRDYQNPWDFFDPSGDGRHRLDDILAVIAHFNEDSTAAGYSTDFDRSYLGPNSWNLGPPNGKIGLDDLVSIVGLYRQDCA